jgi:hypothetical protein
VIKLTISMTSEGETTIIRQPASLARARTTKVFPVPGGPKSKQPVIACSFSIPCWNAEGWRRGRETIVRTESMVRGGRCTLLNVVDIVSLKHVKSVTGTAYNILNAYWCRQYSLIIAVHVGPALGPA